MGRVLRLVLVLGMLSAATCGAARAGSASIVSVSTPRGVQQAFILIKPDHPVASVILFAGGDGTLRLTNASPLELGAEDFDYAGRRSGQRAQRGGVYCLALNKTLARSTGAAALWGSEGTDSRSLGTEGG